MKKIILFKGQKRKVCPYYASRELSTRYTNSINTFLLVLLWNSYSGFELIKVGCVMLKNYALSLLVASQEIDCSGVVIAKV